MECTSILQGVLLLRRTIHQTIKRVDLIGSGLRSLPFKCCLSLGLRCRFHVLRDLPCCGTLLIGNSIIWAICFALFTF